MSGFVKLDCGILTSTLWFNRAGRDVFITALLMAKPRVLDRPMPQLKVGSLDTTGFVVPPGEYGFIEASGPGIVHLSLHEREAGMAALAELGEPEEGSKSTEFDGRRLVRVDGGFVVLNYMKYREKDHTAAARQRRAREAKKEIKENASRRDSRDHITENASVTPNVTEAEAEAEAEAEKEQYNPPDLSVGTPRGAKPGRIKAESPTKGARLPKDWALTKALGDWALDEFPHWTPDIVRRLAEGFADHWHAKAGKDAVRVNWAGTWRNWCRSPIAQRQYPPPSAAASGETAYQRNMRERVEEACPGIARKAPGTPRRISADVIDATGIDFKTDLLEG